MTSAAGTVADRCRADGQGRVEGPGLDTAARPVVEAFADEDQLTVGQDERAADRRHDVRDTFIRREERSDRDASGLGQQLHQLGHVWDAYHAAFRLRPGCALGQARLYVSAPSARCPEHGERRARRYHRSDMDHGSCLPDFPDGVSAAGTTRPRRLTLIGVGLTCPSRPASSGAAPRPRTRSRARSGGRPG